MAVTKLQLDEESKIPLYYQITEALLERIKEGDLKPGDALPSERELCEMYSVSRGTIRQAVQALAEKDYIRRKQGKGTMIKHPTLHHDLIGDYSFGAGIMRQGMSVSSIVLAHGVVIGKRSITNRLHLESKADLIRLHRVRCANEEPWIIEESYLPRKYFPDLEKYDFSRSLLTEILAKHYHTRLKRIEAFIEPTTADEEHARLLGIRIGSPALVLDRVMFNDENKPVLYNQSFVRGDRCRYCFKTSR